MVTEFKRPPRGYTQESWAGYIPPRPLPSCLILLGLPASHRAGEAVHVLTIGLTVGHQEKCGDSIWEQLSHSAVWALKAESKMSFFRAKTRDQSSANILLTASCFLVPPAVGDQPWLSENLGHTHIHSPVTRVLHTCTLSRASSCIHRSMHTHVHPQVFLMCTCVCSHIVMCTHEHAHRCVFTCTYCTHTCALSCTHMCVHTRMPTEVSSCVCTCTRMFTPYTHVCMHVHACPQE